MNTGKYINPVVERIMLKQSKTQLSIMSLYHGMLMPYYRHTKQRQMWNVIYPCSHGLVSFRVHLAVHYYWHTESATNFVMKCHTTQESCASPKNWYPPEHSFSEKTMAIGLQLSHSSRRLPSTIHQAVIWAASPLYYGHLTPILTGWSTPPFSFHCVIIISSTVVACLYSETFYHQINTRFRTKISCCRLYLGATDTRREANDISKLLLIANVMNHRIWLWQLYQ